ncbi:TrmB family transcriptional regulator [Thermoplasma sp.]|uniref:TrmB family transcriptional regulator n=1 Tax=Thermoplasma sp. TaxID=1973142 RepID=UPI002612DAA6|nr:TrmB family transcriptional regulator [Thermoplasma sp.]
MDEEEDAFSYLSKLGLTPYEIKVYKTLLIYGPNSATETAKLSKVPQPRVYDIFESLESKGAVEVSPGKKKVYRAVPIDNFIDRKLIEIRDYKKRIESYIEQQKKFKENNPYLWMIKNNFQIREKMKDVISEAENEIIASLNYENLRYLKKYFIEAAKKGVTVVIVAFPDAEIDFLRTLPDDIVIRIRRGAASQVMIADRKHGIINVESTEDSEGYALYFDENELIHILNYYYYHTIWGPSDTFHDFPVRRDMKFSTAWLSCEAINSFLKRSYNISAEVSGYSATGPVKIEGNITGIDLVPGFKHTFFIKDNERVYSVGGKTARMEDIKLDTLIMNVWIQGRQSIPQGNDMA